MSKKKDLLKSTPVSTTGKKMDLYENRRTPMFFIIDYSKYKYFGSVFDITDKEILCDKLKDYKVQIKFTDKKEFQLTGTCSQSEIASALVYIGYFMGRKDERYNP